MLKYLIFIIGLLPIHVMAGAFPTLGNSRANCDSLWVERNQILNVAGQCFNTALGQAVFDNSDCTPGAPALTEAALNRISQIELAEQGRLCAVNTARGQISVNGRYGPLRFGNGGLVLGRWEGALQQLDVFPRAARERTCTVSGLDPNGDGFLALRSGPDVRYPQISALYNGERVVSSSACMGRWCFAEAVENGNRVEHRSGWFHVRWCQP